MQFLIISIIVSSASQTIFRAYVPATEIGETYQDVLKNRWNNAKKVMGIQTAQWVKSLQENIVQVFENSGDTIGRLDKFSANGCDDSNSNANIELIRSVISF